MVNFEHISQLVLVSLLLTFNRRLSAPSWRDLSENPHFQSVKVNLRTRSIIFSYLFCVVNIVSQIHNMWLPWKQINAQGKQYKH